MELYIYPLLALLFVAFFTREVIAPASRNRCDKRWLLLSSTLGAATVAVTLALGYVMSDVITVNAWFPTQGKWPNLLVGGVSFVITSFIFYWWHRLTHYSDTLWRLFHQLHHSPQRVEVLTAFFAHPMDTAAAVLVSAFSSYVVLGASPVAAGMALLLTGSFDLFLHSDIRTPRWLGYIVQRPEMHTVHHARNHHAQNYGLPLWDLIFNTWVNPHKRADVLGFDTDKSTRISDMLTWKDVHKTL